MTGLKKLSYTLNRIYIYIYTHAYIMCISYTYILYMLVTGCLYVSIQYNALGYQLYWDGAFQGRQNSKQGPYNTVWIGTMTDIIYIYIIYIYIYIYIYNTRVYLNERET